MICDSCEKDLGGHHRYCPENPARGHKWSECVCFVHTCYDAKALRAAKGPTGEKR